MTLSFWLSENDKKHNFSEEMKKLISDFSWEIFLRILINEKREITVCSLVQGSNNRWSENGIKLLVER